MRKSELFVGLILFGLIFAMFFYVGYQLRDLDQVILKVIQK